MAKPSAVVVPGPNESDQSAHTAQGEAEEKGKAAEKVWNEGVIGEEGIDVPDPKNASKNALDAYLKRMTKDFSKGDIIGPDLWSFFCTTFDEWDDEVWSRADKGLIGRFRIALRNYGVYSPMDRGPIKDHLLKLLSLDECPKWPSDTPIPKKVEDYGLLQGEKKQDRIFGEAMKVADESIEGYRGLFMQLKKETDSTTAQPTRMPIQDARFSTPAIQDVQFGTQPTQKPPPSPNIQPHPSPNLPPDPGIRYTKREEGPPPTLNGHTTYYQERREEAPVRLPFLKKPTAIENSIISDDLAEIRGIFKNYEQEEYSKELVQLEKIYKDEQKYAGKDDSFSMKLKTFVLNCKKVGLPEEALAMAFSSMLTDRALDFFFVNQRKFATMGIEELCAAFMQNFEGREYKTNLYNKWNNLTLQSVINENRDKSYGECFELFLEKLRRLQDGLGPIYKQDVLAMQKLSSAVRGVEACDYALIRGSPSVNALVNDIRTSVLNWDQKHPRIQANETLYTDRRFHNNERTGYVKQRWPESAYNRANNDRPNYGSNWRGSYAPRRNFRGGRGSYRETNNYRRGYDSYGARGGYSRPNNYSKPYGQRGRDERPRQYLMEGESGDAQEDMNENHEQNDDAALAQQAIYEAAPDDEYEEEDYEAFTNEILATSMDGADGQIAFEKLNNQAMLHQISKSIPTYSPRIQMPFDISEEISEPRLNSETLTSWARYTSEEFCGVMIDTGASYASSVGAQQCTAFIKKYGGSVDKSQKGTARFKFGIGIVSSQGTITVSTPIGNIVFHVVGADTPFILCIKDLDASGYYFNNQINKMVKGRSRVSVIRLYGHPFFIWGESWINYCTQIYANDSNERGTSQLTGRQLRQLHRRFGHPSVDRLARVLERSSHSFDYEAIQKLTKMCATCQKNSGTPRRFKFTIKDNMMFNHEVIVDIMYLGEPKVPVLHVVDAATRFQAARLLKNISADEVWDALRACWIDIYVGPPDFIKHDAGTQFTSQEFASKAKGMGITLDCVPVEAHHSIGMIERYHAPLRRAYEVIQADMPSLRKDFVLQAAVKAVNDTAGPDGLTPTLLVFGTFPRMTELDPPHPSIAERARTINNAMKEVSELYAKRHVSEALHDRNGPRTDEVMNAPIGSQVLVHREKEGWTGPYQLLDIKGTTCVLKLPHGPKDFRITSVKRFYEEEDDQQERHNEGLPQNEAIDEGNDPDQAEDNNATPENEHEPIRKNPRRERRLPTRYVNITGKEQNASEKSRELRNKGLIRTPGAPFAVSRQSEIDGLIARGVFEVIDPNEIPAGARIFRSRFVDDVKWKNEKPYEKSRLVIQGNNDPEKRLILTQSPTVQRASQRIVLAMSAIFERPLYLRDISQAYTNSGSKLARKVYVRPPKGTNLGDNILIVIIPLYGIAESGTHWYKRYHDHHIENLGLKISTYDPCLMHSKEAIVALQTDDTLIAGTSRFMALEEQQLKQQAFPAKPIEMLQKGTDLKFNGGVISKKNDYLELRQEEHCNKISLIDMKENDLKSQYVRERARGAYIASVCQPEATFALSQAAQVTEPSNEDAMRLNKCLIWQRENAKRGLKYVRLKAEELKLYVFVDASFANNTDLSSQIGFVLVLANEKEKNGESITLSGNILHWASLKCKRVTRSVLASELYALVAGFDVGISIDSTLNNIVKENAKNNIPLAVCTDSYSLYDCIIRLGSTAEKRLMIDIMGLRESYERHEIGEMVWIDGGCNPADCMTKERPCGALKQIINSNEIVLKTKAWVERTGE